MSFLNIKNLSAFYGKAQALSNVDITVEQGEIIAIVGANGAGKSTLLDAVMGMVRTTGAVEFDGVGLTRQNAAMRLNKELDMHPSVLTFSPT